MMSQKKCQCGATPRYHVVRGTKRGRRMPVFRERLVCPVCGNMTSSSRSREQLSAEWESAGWCGQAGWKGDAVRGLRAEDGENVQRSTPNAQRSTGRKAVEP